MERTPETGLDLQRSGVSWLDWPSGHRSVNPFAALKSEIQSPPATACGPVFGLSGREVPRKSWSLNVGGVAGRKLWAGRRGLPVI